MNAALEVLSRVRKLGINVMLSEGDSLALDWPSDLDVGEKIIRQIKDCKSEIIAILSRKPEPGRGRVFVAEHSFRVHYLSPWEPLPEWCYCWCQEGDSSWIYTGNPEPKGKV